MISQNLSMILVPSSLASEGEGCQPSFSSGGCPSRTPYAAEPSCSTSHSEVSHVPGVVSSSCLEIIQRLIQKVGFSKQVADAASLNLRWSMACLYWRSGPGPFIDVVEECCSMQGHIPAVSLILSLLFGGILVSNLVDYGLWVSP